MKSKVVFGLIGAGGISTTQHLPNLIRSEFTNLKTVCDLNKDRLKFAQEEYQVPCVTTNYREVLSDPEIDAVLIATRHDSHVSLTVEALEAGKHVYVEKPLAETEEECRRVVEAQRKSGKIVTVGFNRRMAPAYQMARQIICAHGGAKNIHYRIADAYYIWGKNNPKEVRIIHEVCHIFDVLRFLVGSEVKSVYCIASRPDDEVIVLQFESGCVVSIMSSGYTQNDMPKESLEVIVDLGGFFVTDFVELQTFGLNDFEPCYRFAGHTHPRRNGAHRDLFSSYGADAMIHLRRLMSSQVCKMEELKHREPNSPMAVLLETYLNEQAPIISYMMDKGWQHAIDHFAQSLLENRQPELATAQDGWIAALITQAAIKSRKTGQVVMISPKKDILPNTPADAQNSTFLRTQPPALVSP